MYVSFVKNLTWSSLLKETWWTNPLASWLFQHHTWIFCRHKILRRHYLRTPLFHCKLTFQKYNSAFLYTLWQKRCTAASQKVLVQFSADKGASCHYMQCYFRKSTDFVPKSKSKQVRFWVEETLNEATIKSGLPWKNSGKILWKPVTVTINRRHRRQILWMKLVSGTYVSP